jgi:L-ascorbate metabolism protein UlaG (beta-lactamase superfamily)
MHYGTFRLSFEPPEEPLERLKAEVKRNGIEDRIVVMEEGIPKVF